MNTRKTRAGVCGALLAGGMLLAGPAAIAFAAPGDPSPTDGTPDTSGVNGRPALPNHAPAPVVTGIQTQGDKVFNENNSYLDGTSLGKAYHGLYGRSLDDAKAQVDDPATITQGTQGLSVGVLNQVPRIAGCNIVIQTGCVSGG
jgi:hypothetical protein